MILYFLSSLDLENKLNAASESRQRVETQLQEKERELSLLSVDYRQMQYKLDQLAGDHRQESERAQNVIAQLERIKEEKSLMQSDLSVQSSEMTLLRATEKRLLRDIADYRERAKSMEEEMHKVRKRPH